MMGERMTVEYDNKEIAEALEYWVRDKHLSTYNITHDLNTYYSTVTECWTTEIKVIEDEVAIQKT